MPAAFPHAIGRRRFVSARMFPRLLLLLLVMMAHGQMTPITASAQTTVVSVATVKIDPEAVLGGTSATASITLSGPAPAGGSLVSTSTSNANVASTTGSVTVPEGSTSATFVIETSPVNQNTMVKVYARLNGMSNSNSLWILAPVKWVIFAPRSLVGGTPTTGTVTLGGPAPSGGAQVGLSSNNPNVLQMPAFVLVPAGQSTASFDATTTPVSASTVVDISARYGGGIGSGTLFVDPPTLTGLNIQPPSVVGGRSVTSSVMLNGAAPAGGLSVTLASDTPSVVAVPASVVVPAGVTNATFTITTASVTAVTSGSVTATTGTISMSAGLTVIPASLNGLSVSPGTVQSGGTATGTVTLDGLAPPGGVTVLLDSSNDPTATVPTAITIPAGAASATFAITTGSVSQSAVVTIMAIDGGVTRNVSLTVTPAPTFGMTISPTTVAGGVIATGTITLSTPAPDDGVAVSLTSANTAVAAVPTSVIVPAGATGATFTVMTSPVSQPTSVAITGAALGISRQMNLTVRPPTLTGLSISPVTVGGGTSATGTVTIDVAAPASGATVTIASNTAAASAPATVIIASGATSATFTITTSPVKQTTVATVTASIGDVTTSDTLTVTPPALSRLTINPATVRGGSSSVGTVTLNGPAPASGVVVALDSANDSVATVPTAVTVAAGATSATFTITTTTVAQSTSVTITATGGNITKSATVTVTPSSSHDSPTTLTGITITPASVTSGSSATGTVTLSGPAPCGGMVIALASDMTSAATVPPSVTVPVGVASTTFPITTGPVTQPTLVTVTVSAGGSTKSATLTVTPILVTQLTISSTSVRGGAAVIGRVTLNSPAPAGGVMISLSSSASAVATLPATGIVPAGATSTTFTVSTMPVSTTTTVTLSGLYEGSSASALLTVRSGHKVWMPMIAP